MAKMRLNSLNLLLTNKTEGSESIVIESAWLSVSMLLSSRNYNGWCVIKN